VVVLGRSRVMVVPVGGEHREAGQERWLVVVITRHVQTHGDGRERRRQVGGQQP
jgi:hypothetical protein